ncbi:hypothetical protein ACFU8R_20305 [Pseudonocardia alni]|uniref:hypothetical protein n=1 Tax=Pseudonocardia alni TaxID=33907 RepID=UPI00369B6EAA
MQSFCRDLLDELALVPPFDAWRFCARLSDVRGRRIRIHAVDLGGVTAIGHVLALPAMDRILHDVRAPRPQQELVIYHEAMHLILGHLDTESAPLTCGRLLDSDEEGSDTANLRYADGVEWEAEAGATELLRWSRRRSRPDEYRARREWHGERGVAAAFGLTARDDRQQ